MQSLQLTAHVAADGMLHIPAPEFAGQDVEVVVILSPLDAGKPTARITPNDFNPMIYEIIERHGRTLYFDPPLTFKPYLDETGELLIISDDALSLHVYARTRAQLTEDLWAEIFFLWDEYAKESPDKLTDQAKELQTQLLNRCREESHDAA